MKIAEVRAYPTSFPIPAENRVALGIGTRGQARRGARQGHHRRRHRRLGRIASRPRAPAVAKLVNTTLRQLVLGMDAADVVGVWEKIYRMQLASHGMGAGACLAMSGIDMALWDIRGKARRAGRSTSCSAARRKPIPAYAGGVSLGYQAPADARSPRRGRTSRPATRRSSCGSATPSKARHRAHARRAQGVRRRPRDPDRRQHRLQRRGRART